MKRIWWSSLALAAVSTSPVAAQAPKPVPPPPQDVVVIAPRDTKVVGSFPADGAAIAAGTTVVKIVFDQPMTPEAWSFTPSEGGDLPDCLARPRLLNDKRTFALLCTLPVNRSFAFKINGAPGFVSQAGRAADPFVLHFTTTAATTLTLHDALAEAGLADEDDPIMDWNGAAQRPASAPKP